jgi:hypothetical protein
MLKYQGPQERPASADATVKHQNKFKPQNHEKEKEGSRKVNFERIFSLYEDASRKSIDLKKMQDFVQHER